MNSIMTLYCVATISIAIGVWLMLPRGATRGRLVGVIFALVGTGLLASRVPLVDAWISRSVFQVLAAVTIAAAVATVTCRNPIYSAIWFALTLLASGGLLFVHGAQFLGVATVVVYAGAILVTFLFVIMLAQPQGEAHYDRVTWEGNLAAITGAIMVGLLTMVISVELGPAATADSKSDDTVALALVSDADDATEEVQAIEAPAENAPGDKQPEASEAVEPDPQMEALRSGVLTDNHMAKLGAELFTRHLLSVEIAGTLLLVALVGAISIVIHGRGPLRRGNLPVGMTAGNQSEEHPKA